MQLRSVELFDQRGECAADSRMLLLARRRLGRRGKPGHLGPQFDCDFLQAQPAVDD